LNSGYQIPIIGIGTWCIQDAQVMNQVIPKALEIGYCHIDTATLYENEVLIGNALQSVRKDYARENMFLTSKVYSDKIHSYDAIMQSFEKSLKDLQTDYLDLYLIHWPGVVIDGVDVTDKVREYRQQAWMALEKLHRDGKCRSIGVSNFYVQHLDPLLSKCSIVPQVVQIEYHPWIWQDTLDTVRLCDEKNIVVEAYSPFAHRMLFEMESEVSAGEVLQWAAHGHGDKVVLPKSTKLEHLQENYNTLIHATKKISQETIQKLDDMYNGMRLCDDPSTVA
jgi:diketogulonate reductase-like aldo/keto reductase